MPFFKVTNTITMKVCGYIEWENDKSHQNLLAFLEKKNFLGDSKKFKVEVESYGMCYAILDIHTNTEYLYLTARVEEAPVLRQ